MIKKPFVGVFQLMQSGENIIQYFDNEHQFDNFFQEYENIRWGSLINNSNGISVSVSSRPERCIVINPDAGHFIERVERKHIGGSKILDLVYLKNGRVLGLDNEIVELYNLKNVQEGNYEKINGSGEIDLLSSPQGTIDITDMECKGLGHYIDRISIREAVGRFPVSVIHLYDGRVISINYDDDSVVLYTNEDQLGIEGIYSSCGYINLSVDPELVYKSDEFPSLM